MYGKEGGMSFSLIESDPVVWFVNERSHCFNEKDEVF